MANANSAEAPLQRGTSCRELCCRPKNMLLRAAARSRPAAARAAGSRFLCSNALTTPGASGEVGEVAEPAMDKGTISQARTTRPRL